MRVCQFRHFGTDLLRRYDTTGPDVLSILTGIGIYGGFINGRVELG